MGLPPRVYFTVHEVTARCFVNRLKTLKRAMYGRAGPNLLRARMLPLHHTN